MSNKSRFMSLSAWLVLTASVASAADQIPTIEGTGALEATIVKLDAEFFAAQFDSCDATRLGELVTEDFEFYHDRWGRIASSRAGFIALARDRCERQASGIDYRARRELVPDSIEVEALGDYGALELGTHRFFKLASGQPGELVEIARFAIVWKREGDRWLMSRAISFTHRKTVP